MAQNYTSVPERNLAGGINQQAAEDAVPDGYVENAINVTINTEGLIKKRPGFRTYLGHLPIRVAKVSWDHTKVTNNLTFELTSAEHPNVDVDLSNIASTAILVVGRSSTLVGGTPSIAVTTVTASPTLTTTTNPNSIGVLAGQSISGNGIPAGATVISTTPTTIVISANATASASIIATVGIEREFNSTYSYRYYTSFAANPRKPMPALTAGTLSYPQAEHNYSTKDMFVGFSSSDFPINKDNSHLIPSTVAINETTFDISIGYDNSSNPEAISTFIYALPLPGIIGTSYVTNLTPTLVSGFTYKLSIPASTHNLNSFNILTRCYDISTSPGTMQEIIPNELEVNSTTGQVDIFFEFQEPSPVIPQVRVLLYVPSAGNQYIDAIAEDKISSFIIPDLQGDFLFLDCFVKDGVIRKKVIPESVVINTAARTATVTFDNKVNAEDELVLIWDYAAVKTTKFSVTAQTTLVSSGEDIEPELNVYGILAEDLYTSTESVNPYNGWVQHVDTYRSEGNSTLVAGMGWNLFRGVPRAFAPSYLPTPILYPSLRSRAVNATILAPAFHGDTQAVTRTRGGLKFTGGGEGWGQIQSITWNAALGGYDVVIPTPSLTVVGTPVQSFTPTQPYGDVLTLKGAELSSFEGDWAILSSIYVTSLPFQHVTFTIKTSFEGPDYNCGAAGEAGIFTDVLQLETTTPLLLTANDGLTAQSFPSGVQLGFIGYYDAALVRYVFVNGVSEQIGLSTGQLVICSRESRYCYGLRNLEGTITGFNQANNLLLVRGDSLEVTNKPVPSEVSHLVAEQETGLSLTVLDGIGTLGTFTDARRFAVGQRLLISQLGFYSGEYQVIEISADNTQVILDCAAVPDISLTNLTIPPYFELREALSLSDDSFNRNYFAVEGRWECIEQPQIDTPNLARYALIEPTVTEHFDASDYGAQLPIRSTMSQDNLYLTNGQDPIQKYDGIATYRAGLPRWNAQLYITSGASPSSSLTSGEYRYYFRLSAIDVNENVLVSAITGISDYIFNLPSDNHSIHLRMLGFPNWDDYDFEKLSLEIYRTEKNVAGTYYLVTRLEMPQTPSGGYIDYIDTLEDGVIKAQGVDRFVNTTFGLAAAGTTLSEPLRAKYMTSIDNRLVLGNIRDWQRVELNFSRTTGVLTAKDFVGNIVGPPSTPIDPANRILLLRNNAEDTGTTTDMINRVGFQFRGESEHYQIVAGSVAYSPSTKILECKIDVLATTYTPAVGDWIYLMNHGSSGSTNYKLQGVGIWQIRAVTIDANKPVVSIYMPSYDSADASLSHVCVATTGKHVPVYIDTDDASWRMETGNTDDIIMILRRLAAYVNASMRQVDVGIPGYESFKPWIMADAGGDFPAGQINFVRPKESSDFFSVTLPNFTSNVLVSFLRRYVTGTVTAIARRFPSRVLFSYQLFPELFNAASDLLIDELAAQTQLYPIDINPADGQEITGIVPFFGESAFGGSQREEQLVVFKSNSIYLVDLETRGIQKLQSNGLGCTAPYSIAPTKDGIMFANESGIYKLTRAQTVEPVGQYVDRVWQEEVDRSLLDLAHGHHYGISRHYKLSIPTDNPYNEDVLVYEHTRESRGQVGSWTRYTNHFATGWCNLLDREFFATTKGRVCVLKDSSSKFDFSDRGEAITSEVTLRSTDFGIPNVRKKLLHMSIHFRSPQEEGVNVSQESTAVSVAADLVDSYQECNKYEGGGLFAKTGLADTGLLKGETIRFNVPITKAIRFQPRITNSGLYETLQFSGVTYRVSGMTTKGTKEAKDTE